MNPCDICGKLIDEIFSLCDSCDEKVDDWNDEEDIYTMKDGSKYGFSIREGTYVQIS